MVKDLLLIGLILLLAIITIGIMQDPLLFAFLIIGLWFTALICMNETDITTE